MELRLPDASARWKLRNPDKVRAAKQRFVANGGQHAADERYKTAHPGRKLANSLRAVAKHTKLHPEKSREYALTSARRNPARILYNAAKHRARKYKVEFSISIPDLLPLPTHCPIFSEIVLEYGGGKGKGYNPNAASLDRRDNSKGYISGNVVVMSRRANSIKNDGTAVDHDRIAAWMREVVS